MSMETLQALKTQREELLEQIRQGVREEVAKTVREFHPTAVKILFWREADADSDGMGLYYVHECGIEDAEGNVLYKGSVYALGEEVDEDGDSPNENTALFELLELADWEMETEYYSEPFVIEFE